MTENGARTLEFLVRNFFKDYNVNSLARELNISPGGVHKILEGLREKELCLEIMNDAKEFVEEVRVKLEEIGNSQR